MKNSLRQFLLYLPGAIFIMLGILVVFYPMLLVGLFSAGLIFIGITAISVAHQLRKLQRDSHWTVTWEPVDSYVGNWLHRVFVHRRW